MRFGEVEDLLDAVPEPLTRDAPRAHADDRLHRLEAGSLRVLPWIEKAEEPFAAVRRHVDRRGAHHPGQHCGEREQAQRHTGDEQDARHHQAHRDRGTEVGLEQDQHAEEPDDDAERLHQFGERARRALACEIGADPDAERDLRHLGRLHADRPEQEPAAGTVDRRRDREHCDAQSERSNEEDGRQRTQAVIVEAGREREEHEPGERVGTLLDEEGHRIARAERGRRRRGAEDHHEPECDEPERHEDEQTLLELASTHYSRFSTRLLNSSPRCSKSLNWS